MEPKTLKDSTGSISKPWQLSRQQITKQAELLAVRQGRGLHRGLLWASLVFFFLKLPLKLGCLCATLTAAAMFKFLLS